MQVFSDSNASVFGLNASADACGFILDIQIQTFSIEMQTQMQMILVLTFNCILKCKCIFMF